VTSTDNRALWITPEIALNLNIALNGYANFISAQRETQKVGSCGASDSNEMIASSACLAPSELQPNHHRVGYFDSTSTTAATSASAANISINSSNNASNRSKMMTSKNDLFICQPEDDWRTTLPTPPRSPETSSSSNSIIDEEFKDNVLDDIICDVDALGILEGIDFDPMVEDLMANTNWGASLTHSSPAGGNGTSDLRHDCMWSGTCDDSCKQRMRYPSENSDIHLLTPASSPLRSSLGQVPSVASASSSSRRSTSSTVSATSHHHDEQLKSNGILHEDHSVVVSEFVDPSAVMYTPHADHSYFLTDAEQAAESGAQMTVVPSSRATATAGKTAWPTENYVLSDTPSESDDDSDDSDSNADDEEEIDVVSVHSAAPAVQTTSSSSSVQHVRAHQRSLNSHTASSQRSLLKSKNSLRTAHHKQRKQQRSSTAGSTASSSSASTPATPYLLTPVQSPQPHSLGGPVEYPMPKVSALDNARVELKAK